MKKLFLALLLGFVIANSAQAQFNRRGVRIGFGMSTHADDLSNASPIMGVNIGAFVDYDFGNMRSILTDRFYLQGGLNLIRRGQHFEEIRELQSSMSYREGTISAWYVQLPIFACFRYELPIAQAGHYVNAFVGPAFSVGLFGSFYDRMVSPYMPQQNMNYDTYVTEPKSARKAFNHIRRPDINAIFGIGYAYRSRWSVDLVFDYGFLATSLSEDPLKLLEKEQLAQGAGSNSGNNSNSGNGNNDNYGTVVTDPNKVHITVPNGNNSTVMLQFTYKMRISRTQ